MSSQASLYDNMLDKVEIIRNNIIKIKEYTNVKETNDIEYLEHMLKFSTELNNMMALSEDMKDKYIEHIDSTILNNNVDLALQRTLRINKHVHDIFLPYMLYLQILLQNN